MANNLTEQRFLQMAETEPVGQALLYATNRKPEVKTTRPAVIAPPEIPPGQTRALAIAEAKPGSTIRQFALALGVSHATATYYLSWLAQRELVVRQVDGRDVRHYRPGSHRLSDQLAAFCRDARTHEVARFVAVLRRGLSLNRAADELGFPFGFTKRALLRLQGLGFGVVERAGMRYRVKPDPRLTAIFDSIQRQQELGATKPIKRSE